jgi:peptidoglycan/LPS O-acetylase OafA/YrhL
MRSASHRSSSSQPFWRRHSLSVIVFAILLLLTALYAASDPNTHLGAFYGNAIADWFGALLIIIVTKRLREQHSCESRPVTIRAKTLWGRLWAEHSLSLFLGIFLIVTTVAYLRHDPNSKWGAVLGNLVSQVVQLLGLVLLTKRLIEQGSKESQR